MKTLLITVLLCVSLTSFSQKWTYQTESTPFDGKIRIASVKGSGGDFPYNQPTLVINQFDNNRGVLNIYLADVGYAGCDNKILFIKFEGHDLISACDVSTNTDNEQWFFNFFSSLQFQIDMLEFLDEMMAHKKVYIRVKSDCGTRDYEFPLAGSSAAINYVIKDNY